MRYAVAVVVLFASCSPSPADKPADTGASAPASASLPETAPFPADTYAVSIDRSEIADASLTGNAGAWRFIFAPGGTVTVRVDTTQIGTATYTVTGDRVVVSNDNSVVCRGLGDATYRWTATDSTVAFTPIEDRCPHRRLVVTLKPMRRQ